MITINGKVIPLEVKSGQQKKHASLDYYCRTYKKQVGKGICVLPMSTNTSPFPMAWLLMEE